MTYDFFGTGWSDELAHHTNLHSSDDKKFSIDLAVKYLTDNRVNLTNVYIGYAGYSRSAKVANITSIKPIHGTYQSGNTTGTFESGVTEYYDIIYNYVDYLKQGGRNGFEMYTDEDADADFLYNNRSKLFMSIDTPRTVKAKGEYVIEKGLGGLFTWTIDKDHGLLYNAAREGLGCKVKGEPTIDMSKFYFNGTKTKTQDIYDDVENELK